MNNKDIFMALFRDGRNGVVKKMLGSLEKKVVDGWRIGGNLDRMLNIYKNEVLGIIEGWADQKFSEKELDFALSNIMYLTQTARQRLLPLK